MSQYDFGTIDPNTKDGTQLAADLNAWRDALHTTHKGATRPTYAQAGTLWLDNALKLWLYNGAADVEVLGTSLTITAAQISDSTATGRAVLTGDATAGRSALGLGTMAVQNANAVAVTGGAIAGLSSPLAIADGGTGAATASGAATNLGVDGSFKTKQVFTASGTWTKPANLKRIKVTIVGGGGAGGGAAATAAGEGSVGGGGGGGAACIKWIEAASLGATETVTIGTGGTGNSGAAGDNGVTSTFGAHCSAGGGAGGGPSAANANTGPGGNGGLGGTATGGDINMRGNFGGWGFRNAGGTAVSGGGGANGLGFGGNAREVPTSSSTSATAAATNSGSGGSGPINVGASGARSGGAGGSGICWVEEFY